ncbi:MAG: hypothetical protein M5R40_27120 [Anaerolineae bacterium]|nr:hypothetical protein [Anaerolineae bacterium]
MLRWKRPWLGVTFAVLLALASACSLIGGAPQALQPEPPATETESAPAEATTDSPPPTGTPAQIPGRPDAPAAVDADFRPDPASVVAATGRPQLIEFFAFW